MTRDAGRQWPFTVRDARSRAYRGTVTYLDRPLDRIAPPAPPARFSIILLPSPQPVKDAPERTAICVPGKPRLRPVGAKIPAPSFPRQIKDLWLPPRLMAAYAAGRVLTAARNIVSPSEVFPAHSDRPRLDVLALAIVAAEIAEMVAPYTALIRRELRLAPRANALDVLDERLAPKAGGAPARAPALVRLRSASRRLRAGAEPPQGVEQFAEDLRFLALFDDAPMPAAALDRLLADVRADARADAASRRRGSRRRAPIRFRPQRGER